MNTLTIGTTTFNKSSDGAYHNSAVTFADPVDKIALRQVTRNKQTGLLSTGVTRYKEKMVGTPATRKGVSLSLSITVPAEGFTKEEIDGLVAELSTLVTPDLVNYLLIGAK